ncbi:MAG: hypothetical protein EOO13_10345 [Chitinophagaceae bacterium]|nr:MAG: hypothetical protein EOO13_10345 [Chitinophagaceae bacterium]
MSRKSNLFIDEDGELDDDPEQLSNPDVTELIDYIREQYSPADSYKDSTLQLKTDDIYERIIGIYPGKFTKMQLYNALKDVGFKPHNVGDLELVWLLKEL